MSGSEWVHRSVAMGTDTYYCVFSDISYLHTRLLFFSKHSRATQSMLLAFLRHQDLSRPDVKCCLSSSVQSPETWHFLKLLALKGTHSHPGSLVAIHGRPVCS